MSTQSTIVEYDRAAAERRAERITLRLDAIADNYAAVMPMIREAIEKRDDIALGYNSPGAYISDRFGGSLQRLGVETRRTVVKELTDAGMSTRAIAPVVGTSFKTVARDAEAGVSDDTPEPTVNTETGEVSDDYVTDQADLDNPTDDETSGEVTPDAGTSSGGAPTSQRPVKTTGLDGKEYTRSAPSKPKRAPLTDAFWKATYDLQKITERLERLHEDDRFERNKAEVSASNRTYLVQARDCLDALIEDLANES